MTKTTYHFRDIRVAETPEPSSRAQLHRQLGQELAGLNEQVLRLDASQAKLQDYIAQVQLLRQALQQEGPVSYTHLTLPTNREV